MTPGEFATYALITGIVFLIVFAVAVTWRRPQSLEAANWRMAAGQEQHKADQWRALWERQRCIDDLSPAAQLDEQANIDRRARALGYQPEPTRRTEP